MAREPKRMPRVMFTSGVDPQDMFCAWSAVAEALELSKGAIMDIAQTLVEHGALEGNIDTYAQESWQEVQNGIVSSLIVHRMVYRDLLETMATLDKLGWQEIEV